MPQLFGSRVGDERLEASALELQILMRGAEHMQNGAVARDEDAGRGKAIENRIIRFCQSPPMRRGPRRPAGTCNSRSKPNFLARRRLLMRRHG